MRKTVTANIALALSPIAGILFLIAMRNAMGDLARPPTPEEIAAKDFAVNAAMYFGQACFVASIWMAGYSFFRRTPTFGVDPCGSRGVTRRGLALLSLRYPHATRGNTPMNYHDGSELLLGDIVRTPIGPHSTARGRVVMLGETLEHLDIDPQFVSWVKAANKLVGNQIVVEFVDKNPFEHDDPKLSPVGDYLFTPVDRWLTFESRT